MEHYKDYWPKDTFPKHKQVAYKVLEAEGVLKVEKVIYHKQLGAVEVWFATDRELDKVHEMLKAKSAELEGAL